ncbi:hypothetical protein GCM10023175_05220 [Pseudonocardia xishanensis]|uniref:Enoyl-ACP reductase-like protein n=1 Tax=Pseudonocardia xishanensis TaxID=630995 RepID=A0ABP8RFH2_9PSEU
MANAGVVAAGAVGAIPAEMWRTVAEIDLDGVWHTMTATVPHIRAGGRGGAILLISSIAGLAPLTHLTHYAAAKHGVVGIMRSLANELGPEFIRVNTVNPTNVDTAMIHNSFGYRLMMPDVERPGRADAERPDGPYARPHAIPVPWVDPADVSAVVAFLLSDEARYIAGVAVPVDAGWLVKH